MIRPLTKRDKNGNFYTRPAEIRTAIGAAIQQDTATLKCRAAVWKRDSPNFMPLECLVHIIREARRRQDEPVMSALLPLLLGRCEAILKKKIPDNGMSNAEEIREDILGEFSVLFAQDGVGENPDELDFYECRFNRAFRFFWIDFMRRESAREEPLEQLQLEETSDSSLDEEQVRSIPDALRQGATQLTDIAREELLTAISSLPRDERRAVILCHIMGYKEESKDPSAITAATLCGVAPRTIRNRLSRAAAKLSQFKEDA
jgi:hypothetical protein